jgi:heme o synthase
MSLARRGINLMQINRLIFRGSYATIGDYVALTKPRVMSLVVFTALVPRHSDYDSLGVTG